MAVQFAQGAVNGVVEDAAHHDSVRAAVWVKRDLAAILKTYGTAPRLKRGEVAAKPPPLQAFFDFWRFDYGTASP